MQNRHRNIHRHLRPALELCPNEQKEKFKQQGSRVGHMSGITNIKNLAYNC